MGAFQARISYKSEDLTPILSSETIDYHYGKHHCGYANTLNSLIENTKYADKTLEEIIIKSRGVDQKIFNNAAQLFNHDFYWSCLELGCKPEGQLKMAVNNQFGSFEVFATQYAAFANTMFGSGWSWLVWESEKFSFVNTQNAETPVGTNQKAVCVIDLWEHAYYIDYRNNRAEYVDRILKRCVNWKFCGQQIARGGIENRKYR
ncbi:MAG: superoxide dismutase [Holosporaceae bacterium]|jgi:Fe-Mn family superoxide dismutase|nr:superoxide dismutase [Holosporaceae bacterium]